MLSLRFSNITISCNTTCIQGPVQGGDEGALTLLPPTLKIEKLEKKIAHNKHIFSRKNVIFNDFWNLKIFASSGQCTAISG